MSNSEQFNTALFNETREILDFQPGLDLGPFILKGAVSLILVIGLIMIFYFFISRRGLIRKSSSFSILDSCVVAPGKSLYLIEACGHFIVLGSSEQNLNLLLEITKQEEIDRLRMQFQNSSGDFDKILSRNISSQDLTLTEVKKQIEHLRKVSKID